MAIWKQALHQHMELGRRRLGGRTKTLFPGQSHLSNEVLLPMPEQKTGEAQSNVNAALPMQICRCLDS